MTASGSHRALWASRCAWQPCSDKSPFSASPYVCSLLLFPLSGLLSLLREWMTVYVLHVAGSDFVCVLIHCNSSKMVLSKTYLYSTYFQNEQKRGKQCTRTCCICKVFNLKKSYYTYSFYLNHSCVRESVLYFPYKPSSCSCKYNFHCPLLSILVKAWL